MSDTEPSAFSSDWKTLVSSWRILLAVAREVAREQETPTKSKDEI